MSLWTFAIETLFQAVQANADGDSSLAQRSTRKSGGAVPAAGIAPRERFLEPALSRSLGREDGH